MASRMDARFYFLHSYYLVPNEVEVIVASAEYGGSFACSVQSENIYGVQFHPEKSHGWGIQLLKNFGRDINMLRPRIIPCLLVHNHGLVKTQQFSNPVYVGDPLNAVRIFNEKEVDELLVVDIDATVKSQEPDYDLIANLAAECRMPLAYGGGVINVQQIERIIELGIEKVSISFRCNRQSKFNYCCIKNRWQSERSSGLPMCGYMTRIIIEFFTHNGTIMTDYTPEELARIAESKGAGEFIINNIDRDGMLNGYDLNLVERCRDSD